MDCGRAFADIRPGRQRFATSALLIRKRCRDTDHQRELSLLREVREAGSTQPDARRDPQELQHAGGKSVNVNEYPWWTREGKGRSYRCTSRSDRYLPSRNSSAGCPSSAGLRPWRERQASSAGGAADSGHRGGPCSAWHRVVGTGSLARSEIWAAGKHKTLAFHPRGRRHLDHTDAERVADWR
jgi:hypothetical protein